MKFRSVHWLFIVAQAVLLVVELATSYDTVVRQYALAISNVASVIAVLLFDRWLGRRGGQLSVVTIFMVAGAVWLDALGNFQHWYAAYWWYDRLTHASGGMAVSALFIDFFLTQAGRGRWMIGFKPAIWFGFLVGQFAASMYEVSEWLGDWWFDTERVRGLFDAPRDLLFNTLGGLVAVGLVWLSNKKPPHQSERT